MTPQAILDVIREEGILEIEDDFATDESLFDAGLDSMALMQLLLSLEQAFGKTVPPNRSHKKGSRPPKASPPS